MITAVIPLPSFPHPFLEQQRMDFCGPNAIYTTGRSLNLGGVHWYKYKLILTEVNEELRRDHPEMFLSRPQEFTSVTEVVIVCRQPIDLNTYKSDPTDQIFPLYGRICGLTYIFLEPVARFLSTIGEVFGELITPAGFLNEQCGYFGGRPLYQLENESDAVNAWYRKYEAIAPAFVQETLEEISNEVADDPSLRHKVNKWASYISLAEIMPKDMLRVIRATTWFELVPYVNVFADKTNNVRNNALQMYTSGVWSELFSRFTNDVLMTGCPEWSWNAPRMLFAMERLGYDFYINVDYTNASSALVGDVYIHEVDTGSIFHVEEAARSSMAHAFASYLLAPIRNKCFGRKIHIHKSCMEDITVTDLDTNEVLLYVDLVWWTMAANNGLITRHPYEGGNQ